MRELLAAWRRVRDLITEAEEVHAAVSARKDPTLTDVLLPMAYRHTVSTQDRQDLDALLGVAGHYLSNQYPELREYVLTQQQRTRLSQLRGEIDSILARTPDDGGA